MLDAGVTTFVCLMEEFDIDVPEVEWRRGIGSVCPTVCPALFRRCLFLCTAVMPACLLTLARIPRFCLGLQSPRPRGAVLVLDAAALAKSILTNILSSRCPAVQIPTVHI